MDDRQIPEAPDRPDLTDWLSRLSEKLTIAGNGYLGCKRTDEGDTHPNHPEIWHSRTAFALMAAGVIHNALTEVLGPHHVGLVPTHGLVTALRDLGLGANPDLLRPRASVGKGEDGFDKRTVRHHAILCVDILCAARVDVGVAVEEVASLLASAGHVGRKGKSKEPSPLSPKTVAGWRTAAAKPDFKTKDPRAATFLSRNMDRLRKANPWPPAADAAREMVRDMLTSDIMKSKS